MVFQIIVLSANSIDFVSMYCALHLIGEKVSDDAAVVANGAGKHVAQQDPEYDTFLRSASVPLPVSIHHFLT